MSNCINYDDDIAAGNFSSINITFKLAREMGFFMMDYYVPSILIVVISWVSFWLHVDASAPRIVLGNIRALEYHVVGVAFTLKM